MGEAKKRIDLEAERHAREEEQRIKRQEDAFDDLPEGPVRDHLKNLMLQRAYDLLWDGFGEACDAITDFLPRKDVVEMLDAWSDDQEGKEPKSKWY